MSSAKTEEPTPQRIATLRKKGDVPMSRELVQAGALLGALVGLAVGGPTFVRLWAALTRAILSDELREPAQALVASVHVLGASALPIAGGAALGAIVFGGLQTGLLFVPDRAMPDLDRLTPGRVWTSKFKLEAWVDAALSAFAVVAGFVPARDAWRVLEAGVGELAMLGQSGDVASTFAAAARPLLVLGAWWAGIAATVALADTLWQRHAFMRRNMMSLQEIKDEHKNSEGDPQHKAAREHAHREILAGSIADGVSRADVIVRNPDHIAIGLRYRQEEMDAPVVTVRGRGHGARPILREARRRGVPEYTDRNVARPLLDLDVGEPVPDAMFEAVAVIFRWVAEHGPGAKR